MDSFPSFAPLNEKLYTGSAWQNNPLIHVLGYGNDISGLLSMGNGCLARCGNLVLRIIFFIGTYLAFQTAWAEGLWNKLKWVWFFAIAWNLFNYSIGLPDILNPIIAGRDVFLFSGSSSENIMHVGLGAILLVMFLHKFKGSNILFGALIIFSVVLVLISEGRGTKIALVVALSIGFFSTRLLRSRMQIQGKLYLIIWLTLCLLIIAASLTESQRLIKIIHLDRFTEISPNMPSGTAYWRMTWWDNIVSDVHRQNPFLGLGFGENLGIYNSFIEIDRWERWPVRSPHNFNITVFARMGYAGILLWALILFIGISTVFFRVFKGGMHGETYSINRHKELAFWLMMLVATFVNASFNVLMEGPVLGIWFWFALGFAIGRSNAPDAFIPAKPAIPDLESNLNIADGLAR